MEGMSLLQVVLAWLANPNVAYLLLVAGLLAVMAEITVPGVSYPGAIGVVCLILALLGLLSLPTNWVGVLLIVAGIVMFLLDLKVAGFALSVAAVIAFGLGSLLVFTPFWVPAPETAARLNPWLAIGTTAAVELFFLFGLTRAAAAQRLPLAMGRETVAGRRGKVTRDLNPNGLVTLDGEEWSAISEEEERIPQGAPVQVLRIEGLVLHVRALHDAAEDNMK